MSIQKVSSYIPPFSNWRYDVFLSFRGEDTRTNFTDHLYTALNQKGIDVFRDDNKLERGKSISPELFKAIEESRFYIIVFSKTYAYSTWCLDELVKIIECKNISDERIIFPIFYNVEPTMVRKQTGDFQEAFANHKEYFKENVEKVKKWRDALKEVANISGWEVKNKSESKIIEDVVKEISSKLIPLKFGTHKELVGINSRLKELMLLLDTRSSHVHMIGIYGMGGLGKTTMARVIYDLISSEFEGSSFLANVREISERGGLITLQNQLLFDILKLTESNICNVYDGINMIRSRLQRKKVLLVIDDVVNVEQLESLAEKHDWFGLGSRIIITSRDKHLLMSHRVDEVYKLEELNDDEALQLFRKKAFKAHQFMKDHEHMKDYEHLSKRALKYAAGLPLALKVLGSFLNGRTLAEWESALQRLKRDSTNQIIMTLQISFDGLQETEKKIFLDIACFFKGKNRDYVTKIFEGCDFEPIIGISILIEKSLICITDHNIVWMHDLLQEMGQQIVKKECVEPGKRSRLWEETVVRHVLSENKGSEAIEGIILNCSDSEASSSACAETFSKMINLRLLRIHNVHLSERLEYLSNDLRLLEWHGYPLESLPSNLQLDKIVELSMCYSNIKQMLNMIKPLNNMKFMRLTHSKNLIKTPDFTMLPNLEELDLEGCTRLCEIHPSLLLHRKLIFSSLKDCTSLMALPSKIHMGSLKKLILSGCSKLRKFPDVVGSMECLSELFLDGTAIEELPLSLELLSRLGFLDFSDCKNLVRLPSIINGLKCLKTLKLFGCSKLENVPENLGKVESLEELDISGTAITKPMSSIFQLKNLKALSFGGCKGPPESTSWFTHFPINLMPGRSSDSLALVLPSLSGLSSLQVLDLSDCNLGEGAIPSDISNLLSLEELNLSKNNFVSLPGTINRLSKLRRLWLEDCKRLQSLPKLPSEVYVVIANGCASLERIPDALKSWKFSWLFIHFVNCLKAVGNEDLTFSMLKRVFTVDSNPIIRLSTIFPGSRIPEWFRYQNQGSSITIIRPSNSFYNKNNLLGYAICCVFQVQKNLPTARTSRYFGMHQVVCRFKGQIIDGGGCFVDFDEKLGHLVSDHLWLLYLSNQELDYWRWNFESNHVELEFETDSDSVPGLEVKSCGVHPIYVHEAKEFNKTTKKWSNYKVWNYNESDDQVFVGSPITEYAGTEDSASDEEPHPNRFEELE